MYFTLYKDIYGQFRWNLKSGNNEIIAHGESYINKNSALHAIELVKSTNLYTAIRDLT
jgi:uncharacterized protein YegP (UPF0339 family)